MRSPWWSKIAIKIIASRVPLSAPVRHRLGVFRHGQMNRLDYARHVLACHVTRLGGEAAVRGKRILELGPGDGLAAALLVAAYGGSSILVDQGAWADRSLATYKAMAASMAAHGLAMPDVGATHSLEQLLRQCRSEYLTQGLVSLRGVPDESVDVVFSHSVLQHVRMADVVPVVAELFRVLKPGGLYSHLLDLRDMLGGALNHLRFPERVWASALFARSGFYTNRLRWPAWRRIIEDAGFTVLDISTTCWEALPTPRARMAPPFRTLPMEDLLISGVHVVGRKPAGRGPEA